MFKPNKNKALEPQSEKKRSWWFLLWFIPLFLLFAAFGSFLFLGWRYATAFEQAAGQPLSFFINNARAGWKQNPFVEKDRMTFLLLGLDEIKNQRDGSMLTDTIMLISIGKNGKITLLSLPRDLWIDSLKTKINALYYYGEESEETTGVDLVKSVVEDISGLPIDHYFVLRMEVVQAVIDALGGIDLEVPRTFEDSQFPRDDVDPATPDPSLLYETVRFEKGQQHFDGLTALKYIRSRHSIDLTEGTDAARTLRQHAVVDAVVNKILSRETMMNPEVLGKLYRIYKEEVKTTIGETEIVSLAKALYKKDLSIKPLALPVSKDEVVGIIVNPPITKYKQWVYEPVDTSWSQFRLFIAKNL